MNVPGRGAEDDGSSVEPPLFEVLTRAGDLDLLGPMDLGEQIRHARGFARAFEEAAAHRPPQGTRPAPEARSGPGRWLDLGTGGGLPGLVLAQDWPHGQAVLLDSAHRRTVFLSEVVATLGWEDRVQVVRARAEDAGRDPGFRAGFDAVFARSFGSPPVTAECAAPFLKPGGLLVVSEPPDPQVGAASPVKDLGPARWPREGLVQLGQEPLVAVRGAFGYQVIVQSRPCPERFPRRSGVAAKRPLYRVPAH